MIRVITRFPGAVPTRSKIVRANGFAFMNIVPMDKTGDTFEQMEQALRMLDERLEECGLTKSDLVGVTVFIADIAHKDGMGRAWDAWADRDNAPIRACIGASLEGQDLIELSAIAAERT
ncbi:Rid family hydrolase [Methylobacterium sp. NEAU 140]|uniref:Rid family hydrolase n=1 Tax=Methylobacterium sp. NEAU 140 TaxID=3064945 RepID=UPI002736F3B8|nr:Rid family hydrolase [Methylobacterium sp. NEAU 140]MDP4026590.1 Rid family hydrolase [Methylobacterium sp. NEAU 140]